MNAMLEPRMVVTRTHPPFAAGGSLHGLVRIRASSQGGLAILAIVHCLQDTADTLVKMKLECERHLTEMAASAKVIEGGTKIGHRERSIDHRSKLLPLHDAKERLEALATAGRRDPDRSTAADRLENVEPRFCAGCVCN
jgi:hypothetical protein